MEEEDETLFWLEMIKEMKKTENGIIDPLIKEADELTAIFVATLKTMNRKMNAK